MIGEGKVVVLSAGAAIRLSSLLADGERHCILEHGKEACLADEEDTVTGDLLKSTCLAFIGLGGSRGRAPSADWQVALRCFFVEIGCETSCLRSDLPEEMHASKSLTLAVAIRPLIQHATRQLIVCLAGTG